MARKIFPQGDEEKKGTPQQAPSVAKPQRVPSAVGGLRESLRDITANSIRDIDVERIEFDGLRDRLVLEDDSIDELAESIRKHGQQVPIMVRPGEQPDSFKIVYGRRRLAAVKRIGGTIKAIVRTLNDEASVIAQGQENNLRLDPSFIEKALFIRDMEATGYKASVIQDALGLSRQGVSNHRVVITKLPEDLVEAIGPAHGIGRRQWSALSDLIQNEDMLKLAREALASTSDDVLSAEKFGIAFNAAKAGKRDTKDADVIETSHVTSLGIVATDKHSVSVTFKRSDNPRFSQWIEENGETAMRRLFSLWLEETGSKS